MNEVALLGADAPTPTATTPPCDLTSCDPAACPLAVCPSPSPRPSACKPRKEEGCERDAKELEQQKHCGQVQPKKRVKAKGRLVRSMAVCEEPAPLEETQASPDSTVSPSRQREESSTSCKEEEQEGGDPKKPSLSKEPSQEYTDSTGIDLQQFIVDTLNSNPRDRMMLLKLEQDMIDFITSDSPFKKFPQMSSYHRMLVHRVAAYFGMEHNVDHTGRSVIINRTSGTRIPEQRFQEQVHKDKTEEIQHWKMILKRDSSSEEQSRLHPLQEKQSKSMEEREEEYRRARDRIFNREPLCSQDGAHAEPRAAEEYNPYAETQRRRQLFRGSRDSSGSSWTGSSRQSSTEVDCRYVSDPRPWSSTDSDSSYQWTSPAPKPRQPANHSWDAHGAAAASISLYRLPPTCAHPSPPPPAPAPPPPPPPAPAQAPVVDELPASSSYIMENGIPPGSILVNPHTGKPFLNPDGTPAVYNPPESQQPIRSQPQLQGSASQHQQQQQQVLQYTVSYTAPQMLPVAPSQPYSTMEELSSQFAHVSCQSTGEATPLYPPTQSYVYAAPPPQLPPPNPASYCQPSPQMPIYYYSQFPTSVQNPCKPVSPSQHIHSQPVQPAAGYSAGVAVQQQSSHGQAQQQQQAVMGAYSPVAPHQCSVLQGGVQMSYPPSKVAVGGEAAFCCVLPPPPPSCHPPSCTNLGAAAAWGAQY